MFKLQTLNLIQKFLTEDSLSLIKDDEIEVIFQTDSQLLVKTKRLEDVEHDLFAFISTLNKNTSEGMMTVSTMIESIRFSPVFNGILIYIAE